MASNPGSGSSSGDVFDVRRVRRFIELMNEYELSEIDLRQGDQRVRLRRGPEVVAVGGASPAAHPLVAVGPRATATPDAAPAGEAAVAEEANFLAIRSPMVGTFYASPSPDGAPFVKVGDSVGPDSTVCVIEAMKVFNELPAGCSGKIVAVLAASGDAVEYNQPLFRVAPSG